MEIKFRRVLNYEYDINFSKLTVYQKIVAAIVLQYRDSKSYKNKLRRKEESIHKEITNRDDRFRKDLIALINLELNQTRSSKLIKEEVDSVIVSVSSEYGDSIERVLGIEEDKSSELETSQMFSPYIITRIKEDPDIRLALSNMPILLRVQIRKVGD